jgi:hypothetical protein
MPLLLLLCPTLYSPPLVPAVVAGVCWRRSFKNVRIKNVWQNTERRPFLGIGTKEAFYKEPEAYFEEAAIRASECRSGD